VSLHCCFAHFLYSSVVDNVTMNPTVTVTLMVVGGSDDDEEEEDDDEDVDIFDEKEL